MSFVAVAIGGAAIVGGGVGLYSANKAADTQATAASNALAFQQQAYSANQPRFDTANTAFGTAGTNAAANFQPYTDAGAGATYSLGKLLGIGPNGQQGTPDYSGFMNSPDYQFAKDQGNLGVIRQANAQGMNLSGGVLKDLDTFNSGLASQQYNNYYQKLMGLSAQGANAASGLTSAQTNIAGGLGNLATGQANANNASAAQIGNTTQAIGQAQASGIVGGSNAVTGSLNSGIQNSLLANYLGKSPSAYGSGNTDGQWMGQSSVGGAPLG